MKYMYIKLRKVFVHTSLNNPVILVYLSQMATQSSLLLDAWLQFFSCKNIVAIPIRN